MTVDQLVFSAVMAEAAVPAQTPNPLVAMLPPLLMMGVIFYMLVYRPNQKVRQEHEALLKALKKHDEIVTTAGIHGTVINVKDETVVVRIDDAAKMELDKSAVARVKKARATETSAAAAAAA